MPLNASKKAATVLATNRNTGFVANIVRFEMY